MMLKYGKPGLMKACTWTMKALRPISPTERVLPIAMSTPFTMCFATWLFFLGGGASEGIFNVMHERPAHPKHDGDDIETDRRMRHPITPVK